MSYFALTQDIVPLVVLLALSRLKKNVTYWLRRMYSVPNLLQCPCFCNNILRNNTVNLNNNYPTTYHWTLSAVPHRQQHTVHSRNTNPLLEWKTISATNIFLDFNISFPLCSPFKTLIISLLWPSSTVHFMIISQHFYGLPYIYFSVIYPENSGTSALIFVTSSMDLSV